MKKDIEITFFNKGLRSFIEVDLCAECPRQDDKGCCGYYSPVFYPTDFAYLLQNKPDMINYIFNLDNITVLDASVTINKTQDNESYRCHFHTKEKGCLLPQELRESICRHFVCPGINWEAESTLAHWKEFFQRLTNFEISLNNSISAMLKQQGLTLRDKENRPVFFQTMLQLFGEHTAKLPDFFESCPPTEKAIIKRTIKYGTDWPL